VDDLELYYYEFDDQAEKIWLFENLDERYTSIKVQLRLSVDNLIADDGCELKWKIKLEKHTYALKRLTKLNPEEKSESRIEGVRYRVI
jgi:hypothetical protein